MSQITRDEYHNFFRITQLLYEGLEKKNLSDVDEAFELLRNEPKLFGNQKYNTYLELKNQAELALNRRVDDGLTILDFPRLKKLIREIQEQLDRRVGFSGHHKNIVNERISTVFALNNRLPPELIQSISSYSHPSIKDYTRKRKKSGGKSRKNKNRKNKSRRRNKN